MDDLGWIRRRCTNFLFTTVQSCSGSHPSSCLLGTGVKLPEREAATRTHLVPRLRMLEAIFPPPHTVTVWCLIKRRDDFAFVLNVNPDWSIQTLFILYFSARFFHENLTRGPGIETRFRWVHCVQKRLPCLYNSRQN